MNKPTKSHQPYSLHCLESVCTSVICALLLAGAAPAFSYEIDGNKWFRAQATVYVSMPGLSATKISWNTAAIEALNDWTERTVFQFNVIEESKDPCASDGFSSIDFKDDFCGTEFGERTLAVAVRRFELQELGPPNIIEGDVVVNAQEKFDIFDGPLVQFGLINNGLDFKRVALHEFGHVLGLDHEDVNPSIMEATISDRFELQDDDIQGVAALYGGLFKCQISDLTLGTSRGSLNVNDCTVQELTVGGSDSSFIDIYQFEVSDTATYAFTTTSSSVDTVLLLATPDLQYLGVESTSVDDCDSSLSRELQQGTYLLMVNTFDKPIKPDCDNIGDYELKSHVTSNSTLPLGPTTSLLGGSSGAGFSGGITADNGLTYGNSFSASDSLDISAEIKVDTSHQGKPGFIVVAAAIGEQLLLLNGQREFVEADLNPIVAASRKVLSASESVEIARDLIPAEIGIEEIEVNIFVGYGLDSSPAEVYYHRTALNLMVQPAPSDGS